MTNNDYLLTYRYINASVEITAMHNETELFRFDLGDMIRMSSGKPWRLDHVSFDLIDVADENRSLTVLMESEKMLVVVTLSLTDYGLLNAEVEWKNTSEEDIPDVMLGISIPESIPGIEKITIPSVCYDEKPDEAGNFRNPLIANGGFIAEEHRLSIPCVLVEKHKKYGSSVMFFPCPSHCNLNSSVDDEWSIGLVRENDNYLITLLSGQVMTSGSKDCVNGGPQMTVPYDRGYFTFPAGSSIVKSFAVCASEGVRETDVITKMLNTAEDLFQPSDKTSISYNDYLKFKSISLKNRYIDNENFAGYVRNLSTFDEASSDASLHYNSISENWTIDNLLAAWCDALNSLQLMKRDGILRARSCVDFYIKSSKAKKRGLRYLNLDMATMKWSFSPSGDFIPANEFGTMVGYLADILLLFRNHCLEIPETWDNALEDAADFLSANRKLSKSGLYPAYWNIDGSVGEDDISATSISCVTALAKSYLYSEEHSYIASATKTITKYYEKFILKRKTLVNKKHQANVEELHTCDKKALSDFIVAAMACHEATHDDKYLRMAHIASQKILTFVNFVDYPVKKDSKLSKMGFNLTGLSYVGTDLHALTGLFPSFEIKQIGDTVKNELLTEFGELTLNASVQLASTGNGEYGLIAVGEHPAYLFNTNWALDSDEDEWRGGYADFNDLRALTQTFRQVLKATNPNLV